MQKINSKAPNLVSPSIKTFSTTQPLPDQHIGLAISRKGEDRPPADQPVCRRMGAAYASNSSRSPRLSSSTRPEVDPRLLRNEPSTRTCRCVNSSRRPNTYAVFTISAMGLPWRLVPVVKVYMSPQELQTLFTRSSADPGTRAVPPRGYDRLHVVHRKSSYHQMPPPLYSPDLFRSRRQCSSTGNALVNVLSEAVGNEDRESARHYAASAFWTLVIEQH